MDASCLSLTLKWVASGVFVPLFSILVILRSPCSHITTSPDPGACDERAVKQNVVRVRKKRRSEMQTQTRTDTRVYFISSSNGSHAGSNGTERGTALTSTLQDVAQGSETSRVKSGTQSQMYTSGMNNPSFRYCIALCSSSSDSDKNNKNENNRNQTWNGAF